MNKNLNIVTLNIPYPPDYGGMIDTFYRIRSLHNAGIRIHLHCFEYGRPHPKELESICETVSYYQRKSGFLRHLTLLPFIVSSRRSEILLNNLTNNDYPTLFDGLHSTYHINHPILRNRMKLVRLHNIEHRYYRALAKYEPDLIKKLYFLIESFKLRRYEKVLCKMNNVLPISGGDQDYFNNKYHNSVLMAPFHPYNESESLPGYGEYILYHGDLSVNENEVIAYSLISNVFSKLSYPCIIAGKDPSGHLLSKASLHTNIKIISNPDNSEITTLIHNAHIHLLPALASNGFKLKLLMALYAGRHCLVNSIMANGTYIEKLCHIADSDKDLIDKIHLLMQKSFTREMIDERRNVITEYYNNLNNADKLIELIFPAEDSEAPGRPDLKPI